MTVDFYYMPESPPCRAVEMVAKIVGVKLEKHYLNLFTGDQNKEEFVKINPRHKVPFIVDGQLSMTESRAIMAYLANKYKPDDEHLYPKDPVARAKVDEMLFYEASTFYPAMSKLLYPRLRGPVPQLNQDDEKAFKDCLQFLNEKLGGKHAKRFLLGDHMSLADVAFAAGLTFLEANRYDLHEFKQVAAYYDRLKATIPGYVEINEGPIENMRKFIESKQEGK